MANISSSINKIQVEDAAYRRSVSEGVLTKVGGSINGLIDLLFYQIQVDWDGYFDNTEFFEKAPIRIRKDATILEYSMGCHDPGHDSGVVGVNLRVENSSGAFINNLFGTGSSRLSFDTNGSSEDVLIGREVGGSTFITNSTGVSDVRYGNLNLTVLQEGYIIRPFIENANQGARSINFNIKLSEL